ncbi:hypothetical protein D3C78_1055860 [compost metagenome]
MRVINRIGEQIHKDLTQFILVGLNEQLLRNLYVKTNTFLLSHFANGSQHGIKEFNDMNR